MKFMTLLFALIAFSQSTLAADKLIERRALNTFQKRFVLPADAKDIVVEYAQIKNTAVVRETWEVANCFPEYEAGYEHGCEYIKEQKEKTLRIHVSYQGNPGYEENQTGFDAFETNFKLAELDQQKLAKLPKINFFGKGMKANRLFVNSELVNATLTPSTVTENAVDYKNSVLCLTDTDGIKLDPNCKDQFAYKQVQRKVQILELSAR
jgi:hypothetical protein